MLRQLALLTAGLAVLAAAAGPPAAAAGPGRPVHVTKDLAYAPAEPAGTQGHLLDLYVPRTGRPAPLVVFTHGSGWLADNGRDGADRVAARLNPHGYAVAGVAVRASSQARFPAQLHDIKAAIRWLRAHAAEYHLDPDRIAVMGESSGGWVTTMAAVTGDVPELEGDVGMTGPSSAVQAAVPFYAPSDLLQMDAHMLDGCAPFNEAFGLTACHADPKSPESLLLGCPLPECAPEKAAAANPLSYVSDRRPVPPFLILHGRQDTFVPYHQSRLLYDALAAAGAEARFLTFPHAAHGTYLEMLSAPATRRDAREESTRAGHRTKPRPATPTWGTVVSFLDRHLRS
ncbi:alpha/beta hydrolase [Streptomyces sp. NPDC047117]|uniref:alpha/beta hydrolase n=1 Tax=Streptomyces sp. NPDC047117 TaxID=3155379 RepID=UPI00340D72B7